MTQQAQCNNRLVEAGWLVIAAGLPLCFAPWGRNAFELPKVALLWGVVAVMGAAWLAGRRNGRLSNKPWQVATLVFLACLVLATLLSLNPMTSAQGSYDRMQGALTLCSYLALFLLVAACLRRPEQVRRLLAAIAWGSAPVVAYGLLQAAGIDPLSMQIEGSPAMSTLGRSNFVGAYLVLIVPLTLACAWLARRRFWRVAYGLLFGAQLACLLVTMAQAAWLGTLAAGGALLLAVAWQRGHRRFVGLTLVLGCSALVAGLSALALTPGLEGSAGARSTIWRATWPLVAARPLLGHGPESFGLVFSQVFPPELVYVQGRAVLVDRAHNLVLDTLVSVGGLGLLAYIALVSTALVAGLRAFDRAAERWVQVVLAAVLAAVVGYLVETQFSFPVTATAALFWLALGTLVAPWVQPALDAIPAPVVTPASVVTPTPVVRPTPVAAPALAHPQRKNWPRWVLAALLLLVVLPASLLVLLADAHAGNARRTETQADLDRSIAEAEQAAALWPKQSAYHQRLSWLHLQRALRGPDPNPHLQAAEAALDSALRLTPDDYQIWAGYGELYLAWGQINDTVRFAQAEEAYRKATDLYPGSAMLRTGWGLLYAAQGRLPEATEQFHRAVALDHTDAWAFVYLGDALLAGEDLVGAEKAYRDALRWAPDMVGAYRGLGRIYYDWGWPDAALRLYRQALELAPYDAGLHLVVAQCYRDLAHEDLACETAEQGLLLAPAQPDLLRFHSVCSP